MHEVAHWINGRIFPKGSRKYQILGEETGDYFEEQAFNGQNVSRGGNGMQNYFSNTYSKMNEFENGTFGIGIYGSTRLNSMIFSASRLNIGHTGDMTISDFPPSKKGSLMEKKKSSKSNKSNLPHDIFNPRY